MDERQREAFSGGVKTTRQSLLIRREEIKGVRGGRFKSLAATAEFMMV